MKTCRRCSESKPFESFNRSPRNRDGRHSYCRECQKAHYRANAERHSKNVRRTSAARIEKIRAMTYERLRSGCIDCGISDIRVLEFDHVRGTKVDGVAELVRKGYGIETIRAEMDKCDVRCRNCHAIVTVMRRPKSWHHAYLENMPPRRDSNPRPSG